MRVSSHMFGGDPCPGTSKYVEVHYACVREGQVRYIFLKKEK